MDRRTIWAILLMMVIAVAPALLLKKPAGPRGSEAAGPREADSAAVAAAATPAPAASADTVTARPEPAAPGDSVAPGPTAPLPRGEDTLRVSSPLYSYGISTLGARLVQAELSRYRSMAPGETDRRAQMIPPSSDLLGLIVVRGRDTVDFRTAGFTPSAGSLTVSGETTLRLAAEKNDIRLDLAYTFTPDDYRVQVSGRASDIGPNGGALLLGMGPTIANTEANIEENHRDLALVTKRDDTERTDFGGLDPGERRALSGPFTWAALKSKYFVTGVIAADSTGGRISGATVTAAPGSDNPTSAEIRLSLPLPPNGAFEYTLYAGPMEYERLARLGHDFDDVNPYGWPGFRTIIRIFAVPVRWLLVWMHEHLHLTYGLVLVVFGILVRVVLWPLNQKAMRANMKLQEVQPLMKEIQDRYKNDPQRMQQEVFKLYKEYKVNPLGGCWPMLLPMPVLFALFFVFQNAIELRGTAFMWIPDLSRPDPLYVIPILMGASMYVLTKVGQMGMEPNPQMKMMLYMMPLMMTGMFLFFPSGLNLYYTVSNIASIPQQWLLGRERMKRTARKIVDVKTERPPAEAPAAKKRKKA
ncbi:MAG TPA: membrane protein insertase YidC [Gemmatimonadales bacterium]|jgi:YidC/Oxa1 family membrane protein insertase|nr:membrane protein insertase YidC [Gemmatimonadales bacterium]